MRRIALSLGPALVVSLAACSSGSTDSGRDTGAPPGSAGPTTAAASGARITISGFQFSVPATVSPGAKITVRNVDKATHTVTADDKSFDASVDGGGTVTFAAPGKPGSYPFICTVHPRMRGTLVVR